MNITDKREQSICSILKASLELFRDNGFNNTTVRQIAEKSNSALGMINHYFGNKDYLGAQVLALLNKYALTTLPSYLSINDDPILFDYVAVRLLYNYLFEHGYKQFYLDSLQKDFFFKYLSSRPMILIDLLKKTYHFEANEDMIRLYSKYLPYMMEKTLILKKEEGLFPDIPYDDVPYLICHTAMSHFIPEADIKSRDSESRQIAAAIGSGLKDFPSEEIMLEFIRHPDNFPFISLSIS